MSATVHDGLQRLLTRLSQDMLLGRWQTGRRLRCGKVIQLLEGKRGTRTVASHRTHLVSVVTLPHVVRIWLGCRQLDVPHWAVLRQRPLEFNKRRSLTLDQPNVHVRRFLAQQRRDGSHWTFNFRFYNVVLRFVPDGADVDWLFGRGKDIPLHNTWL